MAPGICGQRSPRSPRRSDRWSWPSGPSRVSGKGAARTACSGTSKGPFLSPPDARWRPTDGSRKTGPAGPCGRRGSPPPPPAQQT
eukprot:7803603-Alexandrium_andersonii.AAC.1